MLGLSTFQAEFDFGVPQFRLVFEPMLVMLAAGLGAGRSRASTAAAAPRLAPPASSSLMRGVLALAVGPVLGETTPHFPLYIVEALVVEAIALRVSTERPLRFGLWAGLGIGTVGLAAEWAWSHAWMPLPWTSATVARRSAARLRRGARRGPCSAPGSAPTSRSSRASSGRCRAAPRSSPRRPWSRRSSLFGLQTNSDSGASAQVALRDVDAGPRPPRAGDPDRRSRRRGRGRRVVRRHRLAGRRPGRRPATRRSGPAATAPPSRSRSPATGRRWSASTRATR